jgi:hypothetical protein
MSNVSPYVKSFSAPSARKLVSLFLAYSKPTWFLGGFPALSTVDGVSRSEGDNREAYAFYLLDVFNNVVQYQFDGNPHVIYELIRHKSEIEALRDMTFENAVSQYVMAREKLR